MTLFVVNEIRAATSAAGAASLHRLPRVFVRNVGVFHGDVRKGVARDGYYTYGAIPHVAYRKVSKASHRPPLNPQDGTNLGNLPLQST